MSQHTLGTSFLGAFQACISVLLTLSYGVAARHIGFVRESSIKDLSAVGIKLFFPALMIVNLGGHLHAGGILDYIPVLVWSVVAVLLSLAIGEGGRRLLKLPLWVVPACAFNNTTSLPLLLIQALESTGSLRPLVSVSDSGAAKSDSDMSSAVGRAQSYLLICAVINKIMTYLLGPRILRRQDDNNNNDDGDGDEESQHSAPTPRSDDNRHSGDPDAAAHEETPLLPRSLHGAKSAVSSTVRGPLNRLRRLLPDKVREEALSFDSPVVVNAVIGIVVGGLLGLTPPLHRAFFNRYEDGGIVNAWLTSSIDNLGKLFVTLQLFTVGCKLGVSFERMANHQNSGHIPWMAIVFVFLVRFVLWPAMSISFVYLLASRTAVLGNDPMLFFSMMLMPTGPSSLVISGLAELAHISEVERLVIVKVLTSLYAASPFISFTVTGALTACEQLARQKQQ